MKKIDIKGVVVPNSDKDVYDWFGVDAICPNDVHDGLAGSTEDVEVAINSPGGHVYEGSEIYTALKEYQGRVTVKIVGQAASAASLIAMAGDEVLISPTAQMMIHNVHSSVYGDHQTLTKMSAMTKNMSETMAKVYQGKSGLDLDKIVAMMDEEAFLTPQQCVDLGLADAIMFQEDVPHLFVASAGGVLSQETIQKVRGMQNKTEPSKLISNVTIPAEQIKEMVDVAITAFKNDIVIDGKTLQQRLDEEEKELNEPKNIGFKRFLF
ncbi:head maturation protease, ClpP-related [Listeria booriae]|uniref:ATP-dependent Clp protease proteolytic subunit n=1 Tax=Listeria booriae TaxID=1552123 RepID=A0A841XUB9_9LIST|nr:head maturation protease, ClpP-related [Listeria booriae]MBC1316599.1 Clp protease ClpP [Listeria booriae]